MDPMHFSEYRVHFIISHRLYVLTLASVMAEGDISVDTGPHNIPFANTLTGQHYVVIDN